MIRKLLKFTIISDCVYIHLYTFISPTTEWKFSSLSNLTAK